MTSWLAAGALAATGLFAGLAAQTGHGATAGAATKRAKATARRRRRPVTTVPTDDGGGFGDGFGGGVGGGVAPAPPLQAPTVSSGSGGSASIVSGAS